MSSVSNERIYRTGLPITLCENLIGVRPTSNPTIGTMTSIGKSFKEFKYSKGCVICSRHLILDYGDRHRRCNRGNGGGLFRGGSGSLVRDWSHRRRAGLFHQRVPRPHRGSENQRSKCTPGSPSRKKYKRIGVYIALLPTTKHRLCGVHTSSYYQFPKERVSTSKARIPRRTRTRKH